MYNSTCEGLEEVYHSFYYFKWGTLQDYISHQLMDFKGDGQKQIITFSKIAGQEFADANLKFDYIVRALGSNELVPKNGNRVIPVAKEISLATGAKYHPRLLFKTKETRPLKGMNRAERILELEGAYALNDEYNASNLNDKKILIVDDISTTGASFTAIANIILKTYPAAKIYGYSVAHTMNPNFDGVTKNDDEWEAKYREALNQ